MKLVVEYLLTITLITYNHAWLWRFIVAKNDVLKLSCQNFSSIGAELLKSLKCIQTNIQFYVFDRHLKNNLFLSVLKITYLENVTTHGQPKQLWLSRCLKTPHRNGSVNTSIT